MPNYSQDSSMESKKREGGNQRKTPRDGYAFILPVYWTSLNLLTVRYEKTPLQIRSISMPDPMSVTAMGLRLSLKIS